MKFKKAVLLIAVVAFSALASRLNAQISEPPDKGKVSYALGMREAMLVKQADANLDLEAMIQAIKAVVDDKSTKLSKTDIAPILNQARVNGVAKEAAKDKTTISYALGMSVGLKIKETGMDLDSDEIAQAFTDVLEGRPTKLQESDWTPLFKQAQAYSTAKKAAMSKTGGEAFLAKNAAAPGITVMPDGLQYRVLQEGTGVIPTTNDLLVVNCRGTFIDGTEFENHKHFITRSGAGLKGWQDALQQMKVGSKWQIFMPANLGYGEQGEPYKHIPADSALIYELELVSIVTPGSSVQMNTGIGHGIDENASLAQLITGKPNLATKAPGVTPQEILTLSQSASPLTQLSWDAEHKEMSTKTGQLTADFSFQFTNISDAEVVIDHVKTSCSCTAAKLPVEPWHLLPHTNGEIKVTVDLKDKMGEFDKSLTVFFAGKNVPPKILSLTVKMPDTRVMRAENMLIAQSDRQAVFKGDCAKCHAEPAKTESGMALYHDVCGICHEAKPRASVVPDLRFITQHPTDYSFWKTNIANGKPGTLMPAFAISQGGPLTDEQIDALAKMLDQAYPYSRFSQTPPTFIGAPTIDGKPVIDPATAPRN